MSENLADVVHEAIKKAMADEAFDPDKRVPINLPPGKYRFTYDGEGTPTVADAINASWPKSEPC